MIGDTNRNGTLVVTDTSWDHNGTLLVTVRERIGSDCWIGGLPIQAMRRLARRELPYPEQTRSSRVVRKFSDGRCDCVTFAISRIGN